MLLNISLVLKKKRIGQKNGLLTIKVILLQDLSDLPALKVAFFQERSAVYIGSKNVV
jgi:hypothetical protein